MAKVTSGKISRSDWLLTWQDFSVMTAGIMKIANTEMSDEEHSDSEFYYLEEQETAERND